MKTLDGTLFARMVNSGAANLKAHVNEINDLNVFPIPDGDTGDNMLMTMMGGISDGIAISEELDVAVSVISNGMLMSARGNSGVILSQFFEGVKIGFSGLHTADANQLGEAFMKGVNQAYGSVMIPAEGTILTVARESAQYACAQNSETLEDYIVAFIDEAKRSLARTPELLPVLKKSGVVDSGAAGLIYIVEGMLFALLGRDVADLSEISENREAINLDAFNEDSVLELGYCTELLVRLQNTKTDISTFDLNVIKDYLSTVGDSIVTVRNGSLVKLHVHTMTPQRVLEFCQRYGEFLKVKIENMSLQHNSLVTEEKSKHLVRERKKYGVVAVACGEGLKECFRERGADVIVDGGQSMNPSAEDFISAFDEVNADVIFVLPNNGNIVLTAQQAARLYEGADVRVIESRTIGAGYSALAMYDPTSDDTDAIAEELHVAMDGVITAEFSCCVRDATIDGKVIHRGDYIGVIGKELMGVDPTCAGAVCKTVDGIGFADYDVCIIICGKDASIEDNERIVEYIRSKYKGKEVYIVDGGQKVYDYILIVE